MQNAGCGILEETFDDLLLNMLYKLENGEEGRL
jgi:hypothetical protein